MPTVNGGLGSLQMGDPFVHSAMLASVALGAPTSTMFQTQGSGLIWTFTGTGFSGGGGGIPASGTITGISVSGGASVTGISYSLATLRAGPDISVFLQTIFAGNDTINGTAFSDSLTGYGGTNLLLGNDGDDLLHSLGVSDTLDGGAGDDQVILDRISAVGVSIALTGMNTGAGVTLADGTIIRNMERFAVTTGSGNDVLSFAGTITGLNTFNAGAGADRVIIDLSGTGQAWSQGQDRIEAVGGVFAVLILSGVETFDITGGSQGDTLQGGAGDDRLIGGDGDDQITTGVGVDQVDGGGGNDVLYLDRSGMSAAMTLSTGSLATAGGVTLPDGTIIRNIERYYITSGSGNDAFNIDVLPATGGFGPSNIDGGAGFDTLFADFSSITTSLNLTWVNIESVRVSAGAGNDTLLGGSGDDELRGGAGNDVLGTGSGGIDLLDGGSGVDMATINLTALSVPSTFILNQFSSAEGVTLANGTVVRNVETLTINAGSGDDTFDLRVGYSGNHTLNGGAGLDTIIADHSASAASVSLSSGLLTWQSNQISLDVERFLVTGGAGSDALFVSATAVANDILNGGAGRDVLAGYYGDDQLNGGAGDDDIYMHGGVDQIDGGAGVDTLLYRLDADKLNQAQIFSAAIFIGMSTSAGVTLSNGAVVRNMEILQAQLGNAGDTILVGSNATSGGVVNIDAAGGFDTLQADFSGDTRQVSMGVNFPGIGYLSFNGATVTFRFYSVERFVVTGGNNNDLIEAPDGNDVINSAGGNDLVLGGFGADTLDGGDGNDSLLGNSFADRAAVSDASADILRGGEGDDALVGGIGADTLDGGGGVDTAAYITATSGVIVSLLAPNTNTGDAAGDTFTSIENLRGTNFNDVLTGDDGANALVGNDGNDSLSGGSGNDRLEGGGGDDTLDGGDGDDLLVASTPFASSGADIFNGGNGEDTVDYAEEQAGVVVNLSAGTATDADLFTDTLISVENAIGSAFADTLSGNAIANVLHGGLGNDALNGGAGDDLFLYFWGDGTDTIDGGADVDTFAISGDGGDNTLNAAWNGSALTSAADSALSNIENVTAAMGAGVDWLIYAAGSAAATVNLAAGTASGFSSISGIERLVGGAANDTLTGNGLDNRLDGSAGDDTLDGNSGADVLIGGLGNDVIDGGLGNDTITWSLGDGSDAVDGGADIDTFAISGDGGESILDAVWTGSALTQAAGNSLSNIETVTAAMGGGIDWLIYAAASAGASVNLAAGTASGFASISGVERVIGGNGGDALTGDGLDNRLDGSGGDDVLNGGSGLDTLLGGAGADTLSGGFDNDSLQGGAGDDVFNWSVGDGRDTIDGGADNDTFNATGSAGADLGNVSWNGSSLTALINNSLANIEAVNFNLGGGIDWLIYSSSFAVNVNLALGTASGFASISNIERVIGGSGGDTLTGDGLDNRLDGQGGADTLDGGAGSDAVLGGDGDDIIYASAGNDSLQGQNGNDSFIWTSSDGRDTFNGGAGTDAVSLTGSAVADVADANWNGTAITGLLNNALIEIEAIHLDLGAGGTGGDWLRYNTSLGVSVNLATGAATGFASITGVENLIGGTGNDTLTGDAGANKINANAGDDIVTGGGGADNLTGGAGSDTFVYAAGAGNDTINDFDAWADGGQDFLDISGFGINAADFAARVAIIDVGADTVIRIDNTIFITLKNVTGDGDNAISQADFILGP